MFPVKQTLAGALPRDPCTALAAPLAGSVERGNRAAGEPAKGLCVYGWGLGCPPWGWASGEGPVGIRREAPMSREHPWGKLGVGMQARLVGQGQAPCSEHSWAGVNPTRPRGFGPVTKPGSVSARPCFLVPADRSFPVSVSRWLAKLRAQASQNQHSLFPKHLGRTGGCWPPSRHARNQLLTLPLVALLETVPGPQPGDGVRSAV